MNELTRDDVREILEEIVKDQAKISTAENTNETQSREERKEGKWITEYNGNGWNDFWDYTCSVCGKKYERADILCKANFCPNCGARMKGE